SNWFGNKRIRFKKTLAKTQEENEVNEANRRSSEAAMATQAASLPMMMPMPMQFMDPSLMGVPPFHAQSPFYFPPYEMTGLNLPLHPPPHPPPQ
ncbi:hypothetical protein PENTCL1PPCAC_10715, partial [Pristionchus entomophagus]